MSVFTVNLKKVLSLGLMGIIFCLPASAEQILPESMKQALKHSADVPGLLHIVLSTAFMVIFIYVIAIIYHKLSKYNSKRFSGREDKTLNLNKLKLINSMSLGTNKSLHVVEINNKFLVIGSTQTSVSLLKEFDKNSLLNLNPKDFVGGFDNKAEGTQEEPFSEDEKIVEELEALKSSAKNSDSELDFERIYKKYI